MEFNPEDYSISEPIQFSGTTGRSATNNNPLNLEYRPGSYQDKYDAELEPVSRSGKQRFAKFPTMEMGYQAGIDQIKIDQGRGHTLASFVNKFAPPHENPTQDIIAQYARATGASADTPLSDIPAEKLIVPMLARESSTKIVGRGGGILKAVGDFLGPNSAEAATGKPFNPADYSLEAPAGFKADDYSLEAPPEPAGKVEMRPPGIEAEKPIPGTYDQGPAPLIDRMVNYLGGDALSYRPDFTEEAQKRGQTLAEYKREYTGQGQTSEFGRVFNRLINEATFGAADQIEKFINGDVQLPQTSAGIAGGSVLGFGGMMLGPYKAATALMGSRLAPTATGLKYLFQAANQGGATLGIASTLSSVIPSYFDSDTYSEAALSVVKSGIGGAAVGYVFPWLSPLAPSLTAGAAWKGGAAEIGKYAGNKVIQLAVGVTAMDMLRAAQEGGKGFFTIDDLYKGLSDGTIDRKELAHRTSSLVMDIAFVLNTGSMKAHIAELAKRNVVVEEISKFNAKEAEDAVLLVNGTRPPEPIPDIGTGERGDIRIGQVKPKQTPMSEEQAVKSAEIGFEKYPKPEWVEIKKRFDEQIKEMEGQPNLDIKPFWEVAHDMETEKRAEIILAGGSRPRVETPLQVPETAAIDTKPEVKATPTPETNPITQHEVVKHDTAVDDMTYGRFVDLLKSGDMSKIGPELDAVASGKLSLNAVDHYFNPLNLMSRLVDNGMPLKDAKVLIKKYETEVFRPFREKVVASTPAPTITPEPPAAGELTSTTPKPGEKTVRIYRADSSVKQDKESDMNVSEKIRNSPEWKEIIDAKGRWFTSDRKYADMFARMNETQVHYIDLPESEAAKYLAKSNKYLVDRGFINELRGDTEYFLPKEIAENKKPITSPENMQQAAAGEGGAGARAQEEQNVRVPGEQVLDREGQPTLSGEGQGTVSGRIEETGRGQAGGLGGNTVPGKVKFIKQYTIPIYGRSGNKFARFEVDGRAVDIRVNDDMGMEILSRAEAKQQAIDKVQELAPPTAPPVEAAGAKEQAIRDFEEKLKADNTNLINEPSSQSIAVSKERDRFYQLFPEDYEHNFEAKLRSRIDSWVNNQSDMPDRVHGNKDDNPYGINRNSDYTQKQLSDAQKLANETGKPVFAILMTEGADIPVAGMNIESFTDITKTGTLPSVYIDSIGRQLGRIQVVSPKNRPVPIPPDPAEAKPGGKGLMSDESGSIDIRLGQPIAPRVATTPGAKVVEEMFDRADEVSHTSKQTTWAKFAKKLITMTWDVSGNIKRALWKEAGKGFGDEGKRVEMAMVAALGASSRSAQRMKVLKDTVYEGIDSDRSALLDRVITAKGAIIDPTLRRPDLVSTEKIPIEHYRSFLTDVAKSDPEIMQRADKFFSLMQKNLQEGYEAGLMTKEVYDDLSQYDYAMRRFEQYMDPHGNYGFGQRLSAGDPGFKALGKGSEKLLETDARLNASMAISTMQARIMDNNAAKAAWAMAEKFPDNSIFRIAKRIKVDPNKVSFSWEDAPPEYDMTAEPKKVIYKYEKLGPGEEYVKVRFEGKEKRLIVSSEYAAEWVKRDPAIRSAEANIMGWLSGAKILRATATGYNPTFAFRNMPRDISHNWMVTQEYSLNPVKAAKQFAEDYAAVWHDAVHQTGAWVDYVNEGGGMEWLVAQGRIKNKYSGQLEGIQEYAGWIGQFSEIATRLAVRNRAILNGKTPAEATYIARTALDFGQGGSLVKTLDVGLPYLNAGVQATRSLLRAFTESPGKTAAKLPLWAGAVVTHKMVTIGLISAGLYIANNLINKECMDQVPSEVLENSWVIGTPISYIDKNGDKRFAYFPIAKEQTQRLVATVFEGIAAKMMGHNYDWDRVALAAQDLSVYIPWEKMPPTMAAFIGYATNKDFWRNKDIWRGPKVDPKEEFTPYTHPLAVKFGQATGMSPARMTYAFEQFIASSNLFSGLVGSGLRKIMETIPEKDREKSMAEMITGIPGLNALVKSTDPMAQFRKPLGEFKMESTTKSYKQRRDFDTLLEDHYAKPTGEKLQKLIDFKNAQPEEDHDKLDRHYKEYGAYRTIPNSRWWMELKHASPEARANGFLHRFNSSTPDEQKALWDQAKNLPGIVTDNFVNELKKAKEGATQ